MSWVDVSGLPYVRLTTCPFTTAYGGALNPGNVSGHFIGGRFALVYACTNYYGYYTGTVVYVFDDDGSICEFSTYDFRGIGDPCGFMNDVIQVGNTFVVSSPRYGESSSFVLPDVYVPGGKFKVISKSVKAPAPPCGGGTLLRSFYLEQQNLIAYEYMQSFSEANNIWASVYNKSGGFVGGGFIGNYPATYDQFNQTSLTLPPYISSDAVYYKNGMSVFSNFGSTGYEFQAFGVTKPKLVGDASLLVCGEPNTQVFVENDPAFTYSQNMQAKGYPYMYADAGQVKGGAADIEGVFLMPSANTNGNATPRVGVFTQNGLITINAPFQSRVAAGLSATRKKLYVMGDGSGLGHQAGDVYVTDFDPTNYAALTPAPVVSCKHNGELVNMHRPISIKGEFLT